MRMYDLPDSRGHFGPYGGVFVAETLIHALDELKRAYARYQNDPEFLAEFEYELKHYVGRPSPSTMRAAGPSIRRRAGLSQARRPEPHRRAQDQQRDRPGVAREAHGQAARDRGDRRRAARRRTATVAARYGMECVVYMGAEDMGARRRTSIRMKLLGATVVPVESRLEDAQGRAERSDARLGHERREHVLHHRHRGGPASVSDDGARFPVGDRRRRQRADARAAGRQPDAVIACVGGGSNAMGMFYPYIADENVRLIGVEAAGHGLESGKHAATLTRGQPGVLHGNRTYLLQDDKRPDHRDAFDFGGTRLSGRRPRACVAEGQRPRRVRGSQPTTKRSQAFHDLCRLEGIIPALESSHALAYAAKMAPRMPQGPDPARQSLRPRRQGHAYRRRKVRT